MLAGAGLAIGVTVGLVIGEEEASEIDPVLSPIFTNGEAFFFRALSRSKAFAIADLLPEGGGVDIFTKFSV